MSQKMKQLTQQQKTFVSEYIKTLDGEDAAKKAGYKSKDFKETANKLLAENHIVKEIKNQINNQIYSLRVQKGYVIQKLLQIAEFSLEEEEITDKDGNYTGKKKLRDTGGGLRALESLCKYLGINSPENDEYKPAKIITISNLDDEKI